MKSTSAEADHLKVKSVFASWSFVINTSMVLLFLGMCGYFVVGYWRLASSHWQLFWAPLFVISSWRVMWRNRERLRDFRRTGLVIADIESSSQLERSLEAGTNDVDLILFFSLGANLVLSAVLLYAFRHL